MQFVSSLQHAPYKLYLKPNVQIEYVRDLPSGAVIGELLANRAGFPMFTSQGGAAMTWAGVNDFNLELINKPMVNDVGISGSVKNPSFVGWA